MSTQSKHTVEVSCAVRQIRDKAIAVADGTTEEVNGVEREKFFWLAKSLITVEPEDYAVGDTVTVTMPEWVGVDKGLL